jgi:hypothetical protein
MKTTNLLLVLWSVAACDQGAPRANVKAPPKPAASVTLTSVAFADDCGGTPPQQAPIVPSMPASPPVPAKAERRAAPSREAPSPANEAPSLAREMPDDRGTRPPCEQTSMQLAVVADAATTLHIKSVEVFDADGKSLGTLTATKPTRWSTSASAYEAWDEAVAAGSTSSVSYVLSQPAFVDQFDARDRTYTVKVIAQLGDVDQPLKTTVLVVGRPPPVPT